MYYKDPLYGYWELPDYIERLIHTKEMVRLRKISQVVLPNSILPRGPMPNRFQHGLGACRLITPAFENNPQLSQYKKVGQVSALYHDAGNSALSHLGENFLRKMFGKDGETFLEEILRGSKTEKILKEIGLDIQQMLALITGKLKPFSDILNGSMDVDNLDNITRYATAEQIKINFDATLLAESFKFDGTEWTLPAFLFGEAMEWKKARAKVYENLYCDPVFIPGTTIDHCNPGFTANTMVYRAVELAYEQGKLSKEFFLLDDDLAIEYLRTKCGPASGKVVEKVTRWEWYETAFSRISIKPSKKIKLSANLEGRKKLIDKICDKLSIQEEDVCVAISKGRDVRRITIPFVFPDGSRMYDEEEEKTVYRIMVYISPDISNKKTGNAIDELVREELDCKI